MFKCFKNITHLTGSLTKIHWKTNKVHFTTVEAILASQHRLQRFLRQSLNECQTDIQLQSGDYDVNKAGWMFSLQDGRKMYKIVWIINKSKDVWSSEKRPAAEPSWLRIHEVLRWDKWQERSTYNHILQPWECSIKERKQQLTLIWFFVSREQVPVILFHGLTISVIQRSQQLSTTQSNKSKLSVVWTCL